ncbi:Propionyl-CoA carboxylase alpha chain [Rhodovastum atsumiense]|uniref:Acetyl/propionyl/methylcrotonyl-CoA carboxylase subunit alpha n=1 Tax=Rhodovastum atsumiense TaxID=504468 RepID=A0A5M6IPJ1_9PROT|nr:acetyl/propionyl/methylcrotonyl-CoA carboxylase subunit alpha [Rhodovastum atsumiense]KAA5610190.1 acetyl/propionyl/methylcrotonyl-CoA carboxylase subunit alpha [Rhodovastum atsumiense]CAH2604198.1 Propionyl-CoA carboxylase alpha chain [Rhodovastum atsumiense]
MFRKILIANRGEIACRVMATCRRMGIASVAVCSDADADSRHVALADEAWPIGPAPARESYLVINRIIEVARRSGAEAIHPGYGFLSENAAFAEACAEVGIVFIGPPPAAIRAMGSKATAKAIMERAGVPLVPGYHGEDQDPATLTAAAARIGYPVLIKASAGGGGKGMRVVTRAADFPAALEAARREAASSFGDDRVLIEKYLTRPRHIEIQVFADRQGNTVSLFERDCSIQRRHQKVIEEAPAPGMDPARRRAMSEAAIAAARAVGYVGAGTVEFIAEGDGFYFMEMNTRLQVEHPVTEMITGQELVEWQIRVAHGEPLPLTQDQLAISGHAIEARIYAEDPARDFLPSIGPLLHLRQPRESADVRVDTGVRQGDRITPHYDPMIAKLIVRGEDRAAALRRLAAALAEYEVAGVQTNLGLLRAIAAHPAFAGADLDTGFILRHEAELMPPAAANPVDTTVVWAAATMALLRDQLVAKQAQAAASADTWSPWGLADAWRLNGDGYQDLLLRDEAATVPVRAHPRGDGGFVLDLPAGSVHADATEDTDGMILRLDGVHRRLHVVRRGAELTVIFGGRNHVVHAVDPLAPPCTDSAGDDRLTAPIPARVARVLVRPGDIVPKGTPLIILEAMKMELTLAAPIDGRVESVRHEVNDMVEEGTELVTFAPAEEAA